MQKYKESMMTPSNLGIPFRQGSIRENVSVELAQLSNTNPDNIKETIME